MPNYRRANLPGGTFFFTVVTCNRQPVFHEQPAVALLRRCLLSTIERRPFHIEAMVVLPDQLHAIWTLPENDPDYSTRWKEIKARFTRQYLKRMPQSIAGVMRRKGQRSIWQQRFWEHAIVDQWDFNRHCDYIHFNPVKHGLVASPWEWKLSTIEWFAKRGLYERDWGRQPARQLMDLDLE